MPARDSILVGQLFMRLNQLKSAGVAGAAAALIIGCVVAPVVNVANQPVLTNRAASLDEIGNAIVRAGVSLNMQMLKVEPGLVTATYTPRGPHAPMEMRYEHTQDSITHKANWG